MSTIAKPRTALEVFLLERARIDAALHGISAAVGAYPGVGLDDIDWSHVGTLHNIAEDLRSVANFLGKVAP